MQQRRLEQVVAVLLRHLEVTHVNLRRLLQHCRMLVVVRVVVLVLVLVG